MGSHWSLLHLQSLWQQSAMVGNDQRPSATVGDDCWLSECIRAETVQKKCTLSFHKSIWQTESEKWPSIQVGDYTSSVYIAALIEYLCKLSWMDDLQFGMHAPWTSKAVAMMWCHWNVTLETSQNHSNISSFMYLIHNADITILFSYTFMHDSMVFACMMDTIYACIIQLYMVCTCNMQDYIIMTHSCGLLEWLPLWH